MDFCDCYDIRKIKNKLTQEKKMTKKQIETAMYKGNIDDNTWYDNNMLKWEYLCTFNINTGSK